MTLRLTDAETDFCEQFAAEHGIVALLDHLDLNELANHVNKLIAVEQAAQKLVRDSDILTFATDFRITGERSDYAQFRTALEEMIA